MTLTREDIQIASRAAASDPRVQAELARRAKYRFRNYFPDCTEACKDPKSLRLEDHGGFCRVLYGPHINFFAAGARHRERLILGGNRTGKTECAAFEVTAHLTGLYPKWWEGRRFDRPTSWWMAGDTMLTTRDILQASMLGPPENVPDEDWDGMIPRHLVKSASRKSGGVPWCIDVIQVKWVGPDGRVGESRLQLKSYDQGRRAFQGTAIDGIVLDEEPPDESVASTSGEGNDIYTECLLRTMTTNGIIIGTFTPLRGLTRFLEQYLSQAVMTQETGEVEADKVFWPEGEAVDLDRDKAVKAARQQDDEEDTDGE